jgi:hypothetical protein
VAEIKVTDKRMFTPDGRLREENVPAESSTAEPERPADSGAAAPAADAPREAGTPRDESPALGEGPRLEIPGTPPGLGAPSFLDLVAVLAEPVSIYLGDVTLPDGQSAENLDAARFHIDLLDELRRRTAGNLSVQEKAVLEDLLYRMRLRYVQKRG